MHHGTTKYNSVRKQNTSTNSTVNEKNDDYNIAEAKALQMLYRYIRLNLFSNPRIVPLGDLTSKLVSLLHDEGIVEIKPSTKTHIRRNLESEFGDTLHFFSAGTSNHVYIIPNNLSADAIACDYINVKDKLETYKHSQQCEQLIVQVAQIIRDNISECVKEQAWPPTPQELTEDYVQLLIVFYSS